MAFANNSYAKVWEVTDDGRVRISTSYKGKDGEYITDFSGYSTLRGNAKGKPVEAGERIQLKSVSVSNTYDKDNKMSHVYYTIFDFDPA